MESLWTQTAPRVPDDRSAPPARTETLVVGAGLTGLALAWMLHRAGRRVAVIEARSVGAVTTGNTTGKLSLLQGQVLSGIRAHAGDDTLRAYVESNRAAQKWVTTEFEGVPGVVANETAITYAATEQGVQTLRREGDASVAAGLDVQWVENPSPDELGVPFAVRAALRLEGQYKLHPLLLLGALAKRLRDGGVPIITGSRMTAVDVEDHGVVARTRRGDVRCATLVLATGASVLDRGLLFAKLVPSRSFAAAYRLPTGTKAPSGMLLSVDDPSRSLRCDTVDGAPILIAGGGAHPTGRAESTGPLLAELDHWVTGNWVGAIRRTWWAAQDYRSVTHLPFGGALPRSGGRVFAATGYNKWGMTNAVASALRIAGRLQGDPPAWGVALDEHHASLPDVGETVQANASVGGHLVADWVRSGIAATPPEPPAEGTGRVVRRGMSPVAESTVGGVTRRRSAVCTHLGGILTWNDAECSWDCPLHGSRFTPDGEVLEGPAVDRLAAAEE